MNMAASLLWALSTPIWIACAMLNIEMDKTALAVAQILLAGVTATLAGGYYYLWKKEKEND